MEVPHGGPRCSGVRMCIAHQKTTTSATPGPAPCEMDQPSASCQTAPVHYGPDVYFAWRGDINVHRRVVLPCAPRAKDDG